MAPTKASILLADDDPAILLTLAMAFKAAGHAVTQASDGAKAIEALGQGTYDLMVLDILMPGATGWEVLEAAIARTVPGSPMPRALLITGFNSEYVVDMSALRREGVAGMLLKPFPAADILDEIQRVLALPPQKAPALKPQGSVRF
jgi:CheY-like chemotaxis protein